MYTNEPFDPWDDVHRPDPHSLYRQMRETEPVYEGIGPVTGRSFWFLTRYDDVATVLRDPRFGRELAKVPAHAKGQHQFENEKMFDVVNQHMLNYDPPVHTRLRRLVSHAFTSKRIRDLAPRIDAITAELLAATGDEFDLIADIAAPLPITVIAELLGVPIEDHHQFRTMVDGMLRPTDEQSGIMAAMALLEYVNNAIDARRADPGNDLLSALIHLEEEGDRLSHAELISTVQLLLIAGHETTVNLVGNGMIELMDHPSAQRQLVDRPELLGSAVEEMLRFNGPVETPFPRFAYEDVEMAGRTVKAGDQVVPVLLAANRDPEHFGDPDRFDITRDPNRHIAFGYGVHFCLGAPLARLEARSVIGGLLTRYPKLQPTVDRSTLEWNSGFFLRGVRSVPVAG